MSNIRDFFETSYNDPGIEREFTEQQFECCTRAIPLGHRCGYVAVPNDHKLYGMDIFELNELLEADGGITFAKGNDDIWVIGWDANHEWHMPDISIMDEKLLSNVHTLFPPFACYMVDADMAETETRELADQIANLEEE